MRFPPGVIDSAPLKPIVTFLEEAFNSVEAINIGVGEFVLISAGTGYLNAELERKQNGAPATSIENIRKPRNIN
jgi:hypothetical protein